MILHFEHITMKLTPSERRLIPGMIDIMNRTTPEKRIKTPQVVEELRIYCNAKGFNLKPNAPMVRKLVNLIRRNSIISIVGTERGYYQSKDTEDIESAVQSLQERADAILAAVDGMRKILNQKK